MIHKFISSKQAVSKALADLDIDDSGIRSADMAEWASEAIEKIGSVKQLKRKVSGIEGVPYIKIKNYQARLPNDLYRLNSLKCSQSEDSGPYHQMIASSDMSRQSKNSNGPSEIKYFIKPGYVSTSIENGYLKVNYDALVLDEDGYPMMPDMISYVEAVYWYIAMKLKYPEYLNGRLNREIYYDIQRSWNFYCKQAYGESLMPNNDEMEAISNEWNKLIPELNSSEDFYNSVGSRQTLKTNRM